MKYVELKKTMQMPHDAMKDRLRLALKRAAEDWVLAGSCHRQQQKTE